MTETGPDGPFAAGDPRPTNAMIERARQTAADANANHDDLVSAASLLTACGLFNEAREALSRVPNDGPFQNEVQILRRRLIRGANMPREYTDQLLSNAIAITRNPKSTDAQLLLAAENLVRWGSLDEADHAVTRLQNVPSMKSKLARLQAASRQLRRSGVLTDLSQLGDGENVVLNRPHEIMVAKRPGSRRAIIVFTGRGERMWVTLSVFHQFLKRFDANVVYLRDFSGFLYLNGLRSAGGDFQNLVATLKKSMADLGVEDIYIMANSSGGFPGLMAAIQLKAKCFLGFGIRTDLSTPAIRRQYHWCNDPRMLVNLRPMIEQAEAPPRIMLYCGEFNAEDRAEAENLRGAPNVEINLVQSDEGHDTIAALLGQGAFEGVLKRFLDEPS